MFDLPPAPGNPWGDVGVPLTLPGVSSPPFDAADLAGALYRWQSFAPEPAPPPPEPPPVLVPPPGPPPAPQQPPANEPVFEPPQPTLPPAPELPPPVDIPPTSSPPGTPFDFPPIGLGVGGQIIVAIGGLLWPSPIGPEPDTPAPVPPVNIPEPGPPTIDVSAPPVPLQEPSIGQIPLPPEVIVVTPSAPPYSPSVPSPSSQPSTQTGPILWPFFPLPMPAPAPVPEPQLFAPPEPTAPPLPSSPPRPALPPPLPSLPPPGITPSLPPSLPSTPPSQAALPPLTPAQGPSVESATCETPQQTQDRRARNRENCRRLVSIKVKAHYRRVCVSQAIEHEVRKERRKLVRRYVTKPAGQLGAAAADWFLKEIGLTPYKDQAKDVQKRVRELTRKEKPVVIPGTDIRINPEAMLPKWSKL